MDIVLQLRRHHSGDGSRPPGEILRVYPANQVRPNPTSEFYWLWITDAPDDVALLNRVFKQQVATFPNGFNSDGHPVRRIVQHPVAFHVWFDRMPVPFRTAFLRDSKATTLWPVAKQWIMHMGQGREFEDSDLG